MFIEFFMAEILLALGLLSILLLKFNKQQSAASIRACVLACFLGAFLAVIWSISQVKGQTLSDGLFIVDKIGFMVKLLVLAFGFATVVFLDLPIQKYNLPGIETYFLVGMQTVGMMVASSCNNWISLFVGLELMYLPTYALIGLQTSSRTAQEAACKYIIMGAFSTGLLLYGISLIYAVTGNFSIDASLQTMATIMGQASSSGHESAQILIVLGGLFVFIAVCFKLGIVPFHWWVRDVYEGGLYTVVGLIASAPKFVLLLIWYRVFYTNEAMVFDSLIIENVVWLIFSIGLLSMFYGHLLALMQERIRVLLAYSSLAHMGFVLLALGLVTQMGQKAAMLYTLGYAVTTATVFYILSGLFINGRGVVLLEDLKGLASTQPKLAFLLFIAIFSLLGLPPFAGFMLKVQVLSALIQKEHTLVAILTLIPTVIAACYYINMVHIMYFQAHDETATVEYAFTRSHALTLLLGGLFIIVVGIYPSLLFNWFAAFFQ